MHELSPEVLALARKAGEAIGDCARTSYQRGYKDGFAAGVKHAESHSFPLPDIEPSADEQREANTTSWWSDPLDIDPYSPKEDTP